MIKINKEKILKCYWKEKNLVFLCVLPIVQTTNKCHVMEIFVKDDNDAQSSNSYATVKKERHKK